MRWLPLILSAEDPDVGEYQRRYTKMEFPKMTVTDGEGSTVYADAEEALKHKTFVPLTISTEVDPDFADEDSSKGEELDEDYKAELSEE